jgi:hypothetical protein
MTDCNTSPLLFSSLGRKKIQGDFNCGSLTSDAGALLLREADKHLGLIDAINRCIHDPRNPFYTLHQQRAMLAQRIRHDLLQKQHLLAEFNTSMKYAG